MINLNENLIIKLYNNAVQFHQGFKKKLAI